MFADSTSTTSSTSSTSPQPMPPISSSLYIASYDSRRVRPETKRHFIINLVALAGGLQRRIDGYADAAGMMDAFSRALAVFTKDVAAAGQARKLSRPRTRKE